MFDSSNQSEIAISPIRAGPKRPNLFVDKDVEDNLNKKTSTKDWAMMDSLAKL
jgi:hypothetical protein